jgi:tRNA pseudouridine38-40 synthase
MHVGDPRPALDRHRVAWIAGPIDVAAMVNAASKLLGRHDFAVFQAADSPRRATVRELRRCELIQQGRVVVIHLEADGFLYKMCRTIAGTLIEVGRGRRTAASLEALLGSSDRRLAGPTAPACGLVLEQVFYG